MLPFASNSAVRLKLYSALVVAAPPVASIVDALTSTGESTSAPFCSEIACKRM
jgi:hypothetical protein